MTRALFLPTLSAGTLGFALGGYVVATPAPSQLVIVAVSLVLVLHVALVGVYVSGAVRHAIATLVAAVLLRFGRRYGAPRDPELAELLTARAALRAARRDADELTWRPLVDLQDAIQSLADVVSALESGETPSGPDGRPLEHELSRWAQSVSRTRAAVTQAAKPDPSDEDPMAEVRQAEPPELDPRLRRLVARRLRERHEGRAKDLVYAAFVVLSGLALVVGLAAVFLLSETLSMGYRIVVGLAVTGLVTYYLNEGVTRPAG